MSCANCCKTFLLLINAVFLVAGLIVLGVGIWVVVDSEVFLKTLAMIPATGDDAAINTYGKLIDDAAYILIAAGGAVTLISFLGCCGAMKANACLLITYSVLLSILVLVEVACIILAVFFYQNLEKFLQDNFVPYLAHHYENGVSPVENVTGTYDYKTTDALSRGIDAFQIGLGCCGLTGIEDYGNKTSLTCCAVQFNDEDQIIREIWAGNQQITFSNPACPMDTTIPLKTIYANRNRPCKTILFEYISDKSLIFAGIAAGVLGLELLGIVMACCLWCARRKEGKY